MKHLHERTGLTFDIGSIKDADGVHTYDMTVIMYFGENGNPPIIIGHYFGDYVEAYTDMCINGWLTDNEAETSALEECHKLVHDHLMINCDHMQTLDICRMDELEYQLGSCSTTARIDVCSRKRLTGISICCTCAVCTPMARSTLRLVSRSCTLPATLRRNES